MTGKDRGYPPVAVVIPARNAAATLPQALDSVFAQDYPSTVEVIVADGSDDDSTRALLRDRYPDVKVLVNSERLTAAGLNLAIEAASAPIIVRVDAHSVLPDGYISHTTQTLLQTGAACVGGRQNPVGTTVFGCAVALATTTWLGNGGARYRAGHLAGPTDTVYLGVFRRDALEAVGGFDDGFVPNEDYELNWRLRQSGQVVWLDPALAVDYRPRATPSALAQQYFRYGVSKRIVLARHPMSWKLRQLVPGALFPGLVLSALLAMLGALLALFAASDPALASVGLALLALGCATPVTYGLALTLGTLFVGLRRRPTWRPWVLMPLALAIIHLAWTAGFWFSNQARRMQPRGAERNL